MSNTLFLRHSLLVLFYFLTRISVNCNVVFVIMIVTNRDTTIQIVEDTLCRGEVLSLLRSLVIQESWIF